MRLVIPPQNKKEFDVSYRGEYFGHIIDNFNIDLMRKRGKVGVGRKIYPHSTADDLASMQYATGFLYTNSEVVGTYKYWAACGDKLYKSGVYSDVFAADTLTNSPTSMSDPDIITQGKASTGEDIVVVSLATNLARFHKDISATTWSTTWWTAALGSNGLAQAALSSVVHPLATFGSTPILLIGDGNLLHSVNAVATTYTANDTKNSRVIFKSNLRIIWIKVTSSKIYIGLRRTDTQQIFPGIIAEYDIFSETIRLFENETGIVMGFIWNDNLHIVDIKGNLKEFTGSGFKKYTSFPTAYMQGKTITLPHRNGIIILEDCPYFLMPGSSSQLIKAGLWVLDSETKNFYHTGSFTLSKTSLNSFGESIAPDVYGALGKYNEPNSIFLGAKIAKTESTSLQGIWSTDKATGVTVSSSSRGFFITPKFPSSQINNIWKNILVKYDPVRYADGTQSGKIIVKARSINPANAVASIVGTWVNATSFTTIGDLTGVVARDEVFVTRGQGSGFCANISTITGTSPKTITLDESLGVTPSGTFTFIVENWKTITGNSITDATKQNFQFDLPEDLFTSEWLQLKVEIRDTFDVEEIQVGTQENLILEK